MSEIQVASRYAKSLIDLAEEQNALEAVRTDIEFFLRTLRENPTLKAVLKNPILGPDKKSGILTQLFGSRLHPMIMTFFSIVVRKVVPKYCLKQRRNLSTLTIFART